MRWPQKHPATKRLVEDESVKLNFDETGNCAVRFTHFTGRLVRLGFLFMVIACHCILYDYKSRYFNFNSSENLTFAKISTFNSRFTEKNQYFVFSMKF